MSLKVYRGRTLARSQALQLLFQAEQTDRPLEDVVNGDYLVTPDNKPLDPYAVELAEGAYGHIDEIDAAISAASTRWPLERMPGADRNLMRIAVYEMRYLGDPEITDAIVINEAVEIAKAFGTDDSAKFVNGVLGTISRQESMPAPEGLFSSIEDDELASEEAAVEGQE